MRRRIKGQIIVTLIEYILILIPEFLVFLAGLMMGKVFSDYMGWIGFQRYLLQFLTYHVLRKTCGKIVDYILGG